MVITVKVWILLMPQFSRGYADSTGFYLTGIFNEELSREEALLAAYLYLEEENITQRASVGFYKNGPEPLYPGSTESRCHFWVRYL